jgi:hypothetical protein
MFSFGDFARVPNTVVNRAKSTSGRGNDMERIDLTGSYPRIVTDSRANTPAPIPPRPPKRIWHDVFYMGLLGLGLAFAQTVMQVVQTLVDILHK